MADRVTVNDEISLHGFNPEKHPLVVAYGKNGRSTKLWWKGESVEWATSIATIDCRGRHQEVVVAFNSRVNYIAFPDTPREEARQRREELIAHQQKLIDEMKEHGLVVLLEQ